MSFKTNIASDLTAVMLNSAELAEDFTWVIASTGATHQFPGMFIPDVPTEFDAQDGLTQEATGRLLMNLTQAFAVNDNDRVIRDGVTFAVMDVQRQTDTEGLMSVRLRRITKPETSRQAHRIQRP